MFDLKYQDFLAGEVLNDGSVVNYRLLSRALRVHADTARQMLYEFHRVQNARKPSSVHANYLVAGYYQGQRLNGTQTQTETEDSLMQDSFTMSSSMPEPEIERSPVSVMTVTLVPQEKLEEVKKSYSEISSISIYSLEPGLLSNIEIVTESNRKARLITSKEDPLDHAWRYGVIKNPNAKRRQRKIPLPEAAAAVAQPTIGATAASKTMATSEAAAIKSETKQDLTKDAKKPASLKRQGSSIMNAFSKTKAPPANKGGDDSPMKDVSDDDDNGDDNDEEARAANETAAKDAREKSEANKKARQEREDQLRKMMEDDAEEVDEGKDPEDDAEMKDGDTDNEAEEEQPEQSLEPAKDPTPEPQVTVTDGRRRGRRRVTKKKTTKDAEGYLVTKEEQVWESFSESEPEPAPKKAPVEVKSTAKKAAPKTGQGNIMSFFTKK